MILLEFLTLKYKNLDKKLLLSFNPSEANAKLSIAFTLVSFSLGLIVAARPPDSIGREVEEKKRFDHLTIDLLALSYLILY